MNTLNAGREGVETSDTVFIDPATLSDLPSHLTTQDLETLVGLNINTADLEALHVSSDSHDVDSSGVLLSERVGNIVEVENESVAMDTSDSIAHGSQSMEIDSFTDNSQSLNDLDLLHHGHELLTMGGADELMESSPCISPKTFMSPPMQEDSPTDHQNTHLVGGEPLATQILKTSSGQFVILQPNQNSLPLSGATVRMSNSSLFTTSTGTSKPILVNANQFNTKQMTMSSSQPQIRTLQLKTPISLAQTQNSSGVVRPMTKVILSSQPGGGNLSQQLRLISSNNNNSGSSIPSTNKIAFQLHPGSKNLIHSPIKTMTNRENLMTKSSSPQKIIITNKSKPPFTAINAISSNIKPGQILTSSGTQLIKIPVSQLSQLSSNQPQTLQLANNKLNFRIVSGPITQTTPSVVASSNPTLIKSVKPLPLITSNNKRTFTLPPSSQTITINQQQQAKPRVFFPTTTTGASSSPGMHIRPQTSGSITLPASALPPGVLSNAQPGSLVMIPAQYFQNSGTNVVQMSNQQTGVVAAPPKPPPPKTLIDANGIKPRKPCNCTKSQCLKLYCDCFANGEFCNNCNCNNCYNNLTHEEDRQKAIKSCLERNPLAFRPKIGKGGTDTERRHNKGCNCKRSGCLKNYCECFEAKIPCSNMCKCVSCRNVDAGTQDRKRLMSGDTKFIMPIRARPISLSSLPSPAKMSLSSASKSVYCRMNQEVVEATCHCLLAQGEKAEVAKLTEAQIESSVISEFSRCLIHIIGLHTKIKGPID